MRDVERVGPTAEYIGISEWKLRDMCSKKQIPHFRAAGRILLFRRSSIESWITEQEAAAMEQGQKNRRIAHLVK